MSARSLLLVLLLATFTTFFGCGAYEKKASPPPKSSVEERPLEMPEEDWPEFPWPPPRASATAVIPTRFLNPVAAEATTLGQVAQRLHESLEACGYTEKSFYAAPQGFAMVMRLEQIYPDGRPKENDARWRTNISSMQKFSLKEYLRALFTATPGFYRLIVFVATPVPFAQADTTVTRDAAMKWLNAGLNKLPAAIAALPFTPDYTCTALIYEFEQQQTGAEAVLKLPSQLTGKTHLERARLWQTLEH